MHTKKIAFYAPLKSPEHEVPSGDRLMARSLIECLQHSGCNVDIVSHLRARISDPHDERAKTVLLEKAAIERERITAHWKKEGTPDCWFCYHPYYKSPDLLGPELCNDFCVPYVTAEASFSRRRTQGFWGLAQEHVLKAVNSAATNLYFTQRDKVGLTEGTATAKLEKLSPFIHPLENIAHQSDSSPLNLLAVAMMRSGDKWNSYVRLAAALANMCDIPWTLHIVGDGPERQAVQALFDPIPANRVIWHGEKTPDEIAAIYASSAVYVWPGCGEAYGLAYLEAQSAGLPVVAFKTAGVPEVVNHGYSGILTLDGSDDELANALTGLLTDSSERHRMAKNARQHILEKHSFKQASQSLRNILQPIIRTSI